MDINIFDDDMIKFCHYKIFWILTSLKLIWTNFVNKDIFMWYKEFVAINNLFVEGDEQERRSRKGGWVGGGRGGGRGEGGKREGWTGGEGEGGRGE